MINEKEEIPMPTRNVNLTDHFDRFVENQVESGKYANASEVFRAGLRLLEQQSRSEEEKLALLRSLAANGFRSLDEGNGITIEGESSLREAIARIGKNVANARESRIIE
jgi:antitoxin ParD1/3/4